MLRKSVKKSCKMDVEVNYLTITIIEPCIGLPLKGDYNLSLSNIHQSVINSTFHFLDIFNSMSCNEFISLVSMQRPALYPINVC